MNLTCRPADRSLAAQALAAASLPVDDLADEAVSVLEFSIGGDVVAFGGLQAHGTDFLLRSIIVLPGFRRRGIGRHVVDRLLAAARDAGAQDVYLLTTDGRAYFARLGFTSIAREDTPLVIRGTRQMAALCPSAAMVMTRSVT